MQTNKKVKEILNIILLKIHILPFITALRSFKRLEIDYGHFKSGYRWESIDNQGLPIPWFTYPAIEYLRDLDLSNLSVFEYGSGNSTLFFSKHAANITSVENNIKWFNFISKKTKGCKNVRLMFYKDTGDYVKAINNINNKYDVIIIDGEDKTRLDCGRLAINKLKENGFIILDNADWYPKITKYLRGQNLIQINFSGFGPINPYTSTTSFFLAKRFNPEIANKINHPGSVRG